MRSARSAASPSHQARSTLPRRCARGGRLFNSQFAGRQSGPGRSPHWWSRTRLALLTP